MKYERQPSTLRLWFYALICVACVTAVYIAEHPKKPRETREQVLERCSRPAPSPFESDFTCVSAVANAMKGDKK